jgi:hypothetical protein
MHGTVQSVSGETVTVELDEGYRVEAGTEGTVLVTKTTFGQRTIVEQGKLKVEGIDGRTVTARLTSGEKIKGGQNVSFASVRSVGTLSVTAQPRGASVSVDGSAVGEAPVETTVEAGTRTVTATAEKCPSASKQVGVERGTTRQVELRLDCPTGTLIVRTDPAEAAVYVDGERLGTGGTVEQTVDAGLHRVEVRADGYQAEGEGVQVQGGETRDLTFKLTRVTGRLTVSTTPTSAEVSVRDASGEELEPLGRTPVVEEELLAGSYVLELEKEGYETVTDEVGVEAGDLTDKHYDLEAEGSSRTGTLIVTSDPDGASVQVDGEKKGISKVELELEPGRHYVSVNEDNYSSKKKSVDLDPGETKEMEFALERATTADTYNDEEDTYDEDDDDYSDSSDAEYGSEDDGFAWGWAITGGIVGAAVTSGSAETAAVGGLLGFSVGGLLF